MDYKNRKRAVKLRMRRLLRLQKRQVEELGAQAEERLENDFFKRLERLGNVRRFVVAWTLSLVLLTAGVVAQTRALNGHYLHLSPVPGGTYTEGILGAFTTANPIYATDLVDSSVSKLVFSGLVRYNEKNQLVGDLAEKWEPNDRGTVWTFHLRPDLVWHDGRPLNSADVLFTYQVIQNPDAGSPLQNSFQGVTLTAPDPLTVTFTLPAPLAAFPYSLTTGILPKHILGSTAMADMRTISFNSSSPVGSGPFQWQALESKGGSADTREEHIALRAFDHYHFGKPKLNSFVIRTFRDPGKLLDSFKKQEVFAIAGLTEVPKDLKEGRDHRVYNMQLTAAVMAFFRTQGSILADVKLRQALVKAADTNQIIASLPYAAMPVKEPLLRGQLGYNAAHVQAGHNLAEASALLDSAGWSVDPSGSRAKAGEPLSIAIYYQDGVDYGAVARRLSAQWRAAGVTTRLMPQSETDFQTILAKAPSTLSGPGTTYDVLLYGISIGVDPDVYVYWDSSQIDLRSPTRLNYSLYKSITADEALEAGRTRIDPTLRTVKYQPFLQAWQADAPALGLYQPRFLYITHGPVYGLSEGAINNDPQRFSNVVNWQIREGWR